MKLSAAIDLYIAKRQAMGEKFYSPAAVLRALSRSHGQIELSSLTPDQMSSFLAGPRITQAIREDLKHRSVLGDGETLQRHIPLQWTEAQKKDISNYQPDQVLVFHRASHGIEKYEALTVTGVSGSSIHTINERGEEKSVSLTQARSFSVHERTEIEVAAGDKLLMMGNRKEPGFRATNGELTTVRSVERGIINLEDGRSVQANYREFTHGYAVTAHRSQGKAVDQVISPLTL